MQPGRESRPTSFRVPTPGVAVRQVRSRWTPLSGRLFILKAGADNRRQNGGNGSSRLNAHPTWPRVVNRGNKLPAHHPRARKVTRRARAVGGPALEASASSAHQLSGSDHHRRGRTAVMRGMAVNVGLLTALAKRLNRHGVRN